MLGIHIHFCFLVYLDYIGDLLEKVFLRRQLYPSLKFAYEYYVFGYKADEPKPLTQSYDQFDKSELVNSRTSRFTQSPHRRGCLNPE